MNSATATRDDSQKNAVIALVRSMAGTRDILTDPDLYMMRANIADKIAQSIGQPLFSAPGNDLTLSRFFEEWYLPQCLFDGRQSTIQHYRDTLRTWRLLMGDPPAKAITNETLTLFRDARVRMGGVKTNTRISPNTVRSDLRIIQTLLDKLGPAGRRNRDAVGILTKVPWVRPPREILPVPRTVDSRRYADCIRATVAMNCPKIPGITAPAWWRALLIVAWNTGLRRGTLFAMRMSDVDWDGRRLVLSADRMKSRRPFIVHLNSAAFEAITSIRTDRDLVFGWETHGSNFQRHFARLQRIAGIPADERFRLKHVRKTLATTLAESNPLAAQFALGHTTGRVTAEHYIDGGPMMARALDALQQP